MNDDATKIISSRESPSNTQVLDGIDNDMMNHAVTPITSSQESSSNTHILKRK